MNDIKAICNDIIEATDTMIDNDISFPDKQKELMQQSLDDALYIKKHGERQPMIDFNQLFLDCVSRNNPTSSYKVILALFSLIENIQKDKDNDGIIIEVGKEISKKLYQMNTRRLNYGKY